MGPEKPWLALREHLWLALYTDAVTSLFSDLANVAKSDAGDMDSLLKYVLALSR